MELLEQELSDPTSPRPPPLPPRPALIKDLRNTMHSSSAPLIMTGAGSTVTSHNQSASLVGEDPDITTHAERAEQRYVSSPQLARPHKSAVSAASQLRANSRRHALDRSRTYAERSTSDTPPALPPPRKFSLPFDLLGESEATRPRSPGQQPHQQQDQQQTNHQQHYDSPTPPSTALADRSLI